MFLSNSVQLLGNLGSDPVLRSTEAGTPVCNFRMATNESFLDKEGQRVTRTEWHNIVAWGKTAKHCAEYLKKGSQVILSGTLRTSKWVDKENVTRYTTKIEARNVQFLTRPKQADQRATEETSVTSDESNVPADVAAEIEELDKLLTTSAVAPA